MSNNPSIKILSLFVSVVGAAWAWMVHSSNLDYYHQQGGEKVNMILTADDASYVAPAANFYDHGIWKDNSEGVSAYVQRPPMIGLINWVIFHFDRSGNGQKFIALVMHSWALFLFGMMGMEWFGKIKGIILQMMYALIPCFWGYLFYFLTESITPSLLILLSYTYFRYYYTSSPKWLLFQGMIIGALLLTRPQLAVFVLPFFYNLWLYIKSKQHLRFVTVFLSLVLAVGGFCAWQIRSIVIAHDFVGIHPIYHITNNSQYRPVHHSFGNMFRIWEHNSEKFHDVMTPFWDDGVNRDSAVEHALSKIPSKVFAVVPRIEFDSLFTQYDRCLIVAKQTRWPASMHHKEFPLEGYPEKQVHLKVDSIYHILKRRMWIDNYITTPIHSVQWMFTKSQLNLLIFQKKFRGLWWMEGLRYFCVLLISLLTLLSISHLINRKNKILLLMALSILIYLFYLFFIQKMNEERYLMPLLPLFLLMAARRAFSIFKRLRS